MKNKISSTTTSYFPSPGAPNYRDHKTQKGWSSERIAKPNSSNSSSRRHTMTSGLTPFSGGRTMPSKWDEAERWICSPPVSSSSDRTSRAQLQLQHHQRRNKSISGPIHVPNSPPHPHSLPYYYYYYSNSNNYSPFSTGVLAPVAVSVHHPQDAGANYGIQYSYSPVPVPVDSEQPCHPSSPFSQDEEEHDGTNNEDAAILPRCDKGTQMSTSTESETHAAHSSSPESSAASVRVQRDRHSPKIEVRDVEVDSQASLMIRGSKRHNVTKLAKTDSMRSTHAQSSSWEIVESTSDISMLQREEAKIIAWENLQKAKAEAAIRKLEMKLEKKRSSSMDKILNKLKKAQTKAENMRSSTPVQQRDNRVSKTCNVFSFSKYAQIMWSPISCFSSSHAQG